MKYQLTVSFIGFFEIIYFFVCVCLHSISTCHFVIEFLVITIKRNLFEFAAGSNAVA